MDKDKVYDLISENMKTVFAFSVTRLGNTPEAEELSSDIIFRVLSSAEKLKSDDRFYPFLWKISENTYADYLRKKYKNNFDELNESIASDDCTAEDELIRKEELVSLRRELSMLSEQYRLCTVMHYIDGFSCSQTADKLKISTEMVKYYLFRARKMLREGMNLERILGEKSYNPGYFEIDFWGTAYGSEKEYNEFRQRKIKGNILLSAYYTPVSAEEISVELGVAMPYLEDELKILCTTGYLKEKNGRYITNIPIFNDDFKAEINLKISELIKDYAERFRSADISAFSEAYKNSFPDNTIRWQALTLCLHFAMLRFEKIFSDIYGALPDDGIYSKIRCGSGIVWGRATTMSSAIEKNQEPEFEGIYNYCDSGDKRGSIIAYNYSKLQKKGSCSIDEISCAAVDCFDYLPENSKKKLISRGFVSDRKNNFAVYTDSEYGNFSKKLESGIEILTELFQKTAEISGKIAADICPGHIRKVSEYTGAFIYQFESISGLIDELLASGWVKQPENGFKPLLCVIRHK